MNDIELKIKGRMYQSPQRARAAVRLGRQLDRKQKQRLLGLIDEWEGEGPVDHVVAGAPPVAAEVIVESPEPDIPPSNAMARAPLQRLNVNAVIRVTLTPAGIAALYDKRDRVALPPDLIRNGGVWETQLYVFMSVFGDKFYMGMPASEVPVVDNVIEVLDPWAAQP